jgi:hypothetical protein
VRIRPGDVIASFNAPPDSIAKISPRTGAIDVISTGGNLMDPWQVAVTPRGRILVADFVDHSILSIDPRTGGQTVVSTGGGFQPVGVARTASGRLIVSDHGGGEIFRVDPSTGARTLISSGGSLDDPAGLAVAPGGRIFVADEGSNAGVYAVNPRTGVQTGFAVSGAGSPITDPYAVALMPTGRVLFADYAAFEPPDQGAILSVGRPGGPLRTVSSGQLFGDPIGLARSFRGPLFVAEQDDPDGHGAILRVNPRTGAQRTVALADSADLEAPGAVAVVPPRCFGRFATIVGGPKADRLKGTRFPDVIAGAGGNDRIRGLRGADRICGGKGRDRLFGGGGRDRLKGGPGRDLTRR